MRNLNEQELHAVSGGEWEVEVDLKVVRAKVSGDEDIQDMVGAVANVGSTAYWTAVHATTDLMEWMAHGWSVSATCSGGRWY